MSFDDDRDLEERFSRRKDRRRPKGGRQAGELRADDDAQARFDDPGLEHLHREGQLDRLGRIVKAGKEATVYLAEANGERFALKVYSDAAVRSFQQDAIYREPRWVPRRVQRRAWDVARRYGMEVDLLLWVLQEQRLLRQFFGAGLPVPEPRLGASLDAQLAAGRNVPMAFVGEGDTPAPRLADLRLEPDQVEDAFEQSLAIYAGMLREGWVHGDFSTFNLLWHEGRVVLIDLPQAVDARRHPAARELMARDARSLAGSFGQLGVEADPQAILDRVRSEAKTPT